MMLFLMSEKRHVSLWTWFFYVCEIVPLHMIPLRWFLWIWFLWIWFLRDGSSEYDSSEMVPLNMIPLRWFLWIWFLWDGSSGHDSSLPLCLSDGSFTFCIWLLYAWEIVPLCMIPSSCEVIPLSLWDDSSWYDTSMLTSQLVRWFLYIRVLYACEMVPLSMILLSLWCGASELGLSLWDGSCARFLCTCEMAMISLSLSDDSSAYDSSMLVRWFHCTCMIPLCSLRLLCIWNVHMRYHILHPWDGSFMHKKWTTGIVQVRT